MRHANQQEWSLHVEAATQSPRVTVKCKEWLDTEVTRAFISTYADRVLVTLAGLTYTVLSAPT